ncbi:Glycoside hydrolase 2 (Mannanase, beta-galactosidase) [Mycoemilia scoparia]|uniref:Glycoside hydrolase 2 (Mannanase, beta-galactosidase) n=1 Tax=Mycoemilia scoparia TaxID=417184 RepID=A0A9W8DPA5_9FUNG|nr:Glycoside hydrolase 2 (Mannanase, beta-galactosidase) [Mycoemilia scoparia]
MDAAPSNKPHRPNRAGASAKSKKKPTTQKNNPKAFAMQSAVKADRMARRRIEKNEKKLHVPMVDRTPLEAPPVIVVVAGPPGCGKTTLIKSLVRRYTKHTLSEIRGPVTVVSNKKQRLTFIECQNDLNSMMDAAKVADLILLMIDASFGFEMETFEFLNILQTHGFPKIMGILTHLDHFKDSKRLRNTKKVLKHRFWTEIYQGAKLFYLSGVINGRYPDQEVLNLSRFISVMKFRPLAWRNSHPYMISDRLEDLTDRELIHSNPKCNRTITLYGYLRGTNMKKKTNVHIPGAGDFVVDDISILNDPCPFPDKEKKRLDERQKLIYAPMSDVGGLIYDKDAVYINVPGNFTKSSAKVKQDADGTATVPDNGDGSDSDDDEPQGTGERMIMNLQDANQVLTDPLKGSGFRLFSQSAPIERNDISFAGDQEEGGDNDDVIGEEGAETGRRRRIAQFGGDDAENRDVDSDAEADGKVAFADTDSELENESDGYENVTGTGQSSFNRWKAEMNERSKGADFGRKRVNLMELVYGPQDGYTAGNNGQGSDSEGEDADDSGNNNKPEDDSDFFKLKRTIAIGSDNEGEEEEEEDEEAQPDSCKASMAWDDLDKWNDVDAIDEIRQRFITGKLGDDEDYNEDDGENSSQSESGKYEEFNGLSGEEESGNEHDSDESDGDGNEDEDGDETNPENEDGEDEEVDQEALELAKKKEYLKKKFDEEYDGEDDDEGPKKDFYEDQKDMIEKQLQINREEFEEDDPELRAQVEGYRPGQYVRMLFKDIPCELVEYFDPAYPIIVGGLLPNESNFGFVQVRIKRHRWHKKILKTNDPLIFSIGWRRFQSIPTYALNDRIKTKMLKYTPEHMHCLAVFYGPITAPNTGFCAMQSTSKHSADFRISATGVVIDVDQGTEIVKKLKLTGVPHKILKNSAFIKNMFNSPLEVAKFEGAQIKTVSGIRGQIKKAAPSPAGAFRATFEDKILMSDIVFLRAWYPVQPKKFYNPVTSLLIRDKKQWEGMRLAVQIRRDKGIPLKVNVDSHYKPIERAARKFNKLNIPRSLQAELPYASKPKNQTKKKRPGLLERRAVVLEPEERRIARLMNQINLLSKDKAEKRKIKKQAERETYLKKKQQAESVDQMHDKARRREFFRKEGIEAKRKSEAESGAARFKKPKRGD